MYRYFYELDYFPVPENAKKEYLKKSAKSQAPKIKNKIDDGVYEVEDNELFYTSNYDDYNVLIYRFALSTDSNINVQVTRYKKIGSATYSICVKTSSQIPGIKVMKVPWQTDLLKPITFNMDDYGQLDNPAYLVKKDGFTVDLIGMDGLLYAVNGNYGILIGITKSKDNLFAKGELMGDLIYIFDAFIVNGKSLGVPFKERMKLFNDIIQDIKLEGRPISQIKISTLHDNFANAYEESKTISNDGIIIQDDYKVPLKWKPESVNTVDMLVEDDLYVSKGHDQLISFKAIKNPQFNMKLIWEYRNKYAGEIIEVGIDGKFHRVRYDKLKPNAIRTYKNSLDKSATIPVYVMLGEGLAPYIFNSYKGLMLERYVHGETIEISTDCGIINKVNTLLNKSNIITLNPDLSKNTCKIENRIDKPLDEYLSNSEPLDTIIVENPSDKILDQLGEKLKDCGKIILFNYQSKHDESKFTVLEQFFIPKLERFPAIAQKELSQMSALILCKKSDQPVKPEFIFVVGLKGTGKSVMIEYIRNFVHPSTALTIINIDDMVVEKIQYQLYPNPEMYNEMRKILNPIVDKKMDDLIATKQSILLETTRISKEWAEMIGKTHKTIAVICNTNFGQIESNIEARNKTNIRKTTADKDEYDKFQITIESYPEFIDEVYKYDMSKALNNTEDGLSKIKGGYFSLIEPNSILDYSGGSPEDTSIIESKIPGPYIKLSDLKEEKQYIPYHKHPNKGVHYGQRKLLITEIMFLTMVCDPTKQYHIIYAGSAANYKYPVLHELFKNCRFVLIDPNPFAPVVREKENLYYTDKIDINEIQSKKEIRTIIINNICTIPLVNELSILDNIMFISDIRTNLVLDSPLEYDVLFNVAQHKSWLDILYAKDNNIKFLLKSRCIYSLDQSEYLDDFKKIVDHIDEWNLHGKYLLEQFDNGRQLDFVGETYLQPWSGEDSTEVRIIGNKPDLEEKDGNRNERKLFYYNVHLRIDDKKRAISGKDAWNLDEKELSSVDQKAFELYCGCNDCGIEIHWIKEYAKKYPIKLDAIVNLINLYAQPITNHKGGKSKILKFDVNESRKKILNDSIYKNQFN